MFSFPESFRELYRFVQSSPRSVGMGCKWKEAWRGQFSWIKPVAGNPSKVSCSACEKELSCEKGVNDLKVKKKAKKRVAIEKVDVAKKKKKLSFLL